jgi:hypothetical protein
VLVEQIGKGHHRLRVGSRRCYTVSPRVVSMSIGQARLGLTATLFAQAPERDLLLSAKQLFFAAMTNGPHERRAGWRTISPTLEPH